jgi:hypothetical protein
MPDTTDRHPTISSLAHGMQSNYRQATAVAAVERHDAPPYFV